MNHRTKNVLKNVSSFRFHSKRLVYQLKKKKYLHKKNGLKTSKRSGTSSDVVLRAEENFKKYQLDVAEKTSLQLLPRKTTGMTKVANLRLNMVIPK